MGIEDYQVGTSYVAPLTGLKAATSLSDGADAFSAHHLRALARNGNLAMTTAQHIVTLAWPTFDPGEGINRSPILYAYPAWRQILLPIPIAYKPGHTHAQVRARLLVESGKTVYLGFATTTNGRNEYTMPDDDAAVLKVGGTGAWATYDLDGVPLGPSNDQALQLYLRATKDSSASGSGPATGTVDQVGVNWINDDGVTWNVPGYAKGGLIEFDRSGFALTRMRRVIGFRPTQTNDILLVDPPFSPQEQAILTQDTTTYTIYQQPSLRIGSISLAAEASL